MREASKRVFLAELIKTTVSFKTEGDQYSPTYVVTPTGEKCNRVLIAGRVVSKQQIGNDTDNWKCKITDGTAQMYVFVGIYQPHALGVMPSINEGDYIGVVGKPNVSNFNDGGIFVSLRAEYIAKIEPETYCIWVLDTANATLNRLKDIPNNNERADFAVKIYDINMRDYESICRQMIDKVMAYVTGANPLPPV